jgi:hypothetical protein
MDSRGFFYRISKVVGRFPPLCSNSQGYLSFLCFPSWKVVKRGKIYSTFPFFTRYLYIKYGVLWKASCTWNYSLKNGSTQIEDDPKINLTARITLMWKHWKESMGTKPHLSLRCTTFEDKNRCRRCRYRYLKTEQITDSVSIQNLSSLWMAILSYQSIFVPLFNAPVDNLNKYIKMIG